MVSDVFSFLWTIPAHGYQWVKERVIENDGGNPSVATNQSRIKDKPEWVLTDTVAVGQTYSQRQYTPLDTFTGLFQTFARLPPRDRDGILAFANQYGGLGIARPLYITAKDEPDRVLPFWGETWQDWGQQIDAMWLAVNVWEMVKTKDVVGLSHHVRFRDGAWHYDSHPDLAPFQVHPQRVTRATYLIPPVLDLFKAGDVVMPASFLVQRWVNDHLEGQVRPQLVYHLERGERVLQIVPNHLLSAMWLQLGQAIAGNKEYRSCKECGKFFELSHKQADRRTMRREFCSDPCKSKDYRSRRARAQRLKAEGKPVKAIATELETDVETVKKWITNKKE